MTETGLVLDIYLTVAYGHAIPEVAENAQKAVASAVSDMTGCTVETVNHPCGWRDPGLIARLNKREKDERSYDTEYRTGNCRASFLRIELHG